MKTFAFEAFRDDCKYGTPENWLCVDCSVNTAPGFLPRIEKEQAFNAGHESVEEYVDDQSEVYMVRVAVWEAAGMEPFGGCLCIGCLEQRLGRRLKPKDFLRGHSFNTMPGTPRLLQRQKRHR